MKLFKKIFNFNNDFVTKQDINLSVEPYKKIGTIIKEKRLLLNLSIRDLSYISRIPQSTINAIEQNDEELIPQYPFIRSILLKLEECLNLEKSCLTGLVQKEIKPIKKKI